MPLSTRRPASATCLSSGALPITKAVRPEWPSASRCCIAPPTVTTSPSDARMPIFQSCATRSSPDSNALLVAKAKGLPAERTSSSASTTPGVGSSPTHTQPSRSRMNWS